MLKGCLARGSRELVAVVVFFSCAAVAPPATRAVSATPLDFTQFSMEPTERTVVQATEGNWRVINEPYKEPFTQAGGHPWALTVKGAFATEEVESVNKQRFPVPTRDPKNVVADLPPGLLGNPMSTPRCSLTVVVGSSEPCPADTQIGTYAVWLVGKELVGPIINVIPEAGQSAEFALENSTKVDTPLLTGHLVRAAQGYSLATVSDDIPLLGVERFETTFWGVPADPSHNQMRGMLCAQAGFGTPLVCEGGGLPSGIEPVPFLTMPADCSAGAETATLRANSWEEPQTYTEVETTLPGPTGCASLTFQPFIELHPDTLLADEPVGVNLNVQVPLTETPTTDATPQLRDSVVTLPNGMSISPGVVDGVQACNAFGSEGINITGPESEEVGLSGELQLAPGHCPDASTLGTAEAVTPFLPVPVKGHLYLARPECGGAREDPCTEADLIDGKLYRLYLELGGTGALARTGIHFKVQLETHVNPSTGQLTTTALETPQLPFGELKIHLNGGPRAPLDTPFGCGHATTTADFRPWSAPGTTPEGIFVPGVADATSTSFFEVHGCPASPVLHPQFVAGTVSPHAGSFTQFTLDLSRSDREQYLRGIQVHTPQGLSGMLANVQLCDTAAAETGTCPQESQIGTTRVASGAGSHPFEIAGAVYLTGPYAKAPFGLSIVTHVVAGPFNLGVVVVRARIDVDPHTAMLTVTPDETGPHAIPRIVFGVPLRLKRITVNIDRPSFMFNPTNCSAKDVTAVVSSWEGSVVEVSNPFVASGCASLVFKPRFSASTNGRTSRANGASLDTKLSYPLPSAGKTANIARVKVSLPKQLPSRLTTLQKACPAMTFETNPAHCPSASIVGIVRASTPVLPVGLTGPVYFVSHGGEKFPSLVIVLQGDGVRVDLSGETFISKAGITSSTFRAIPDVPVNTFELFLPQGRYSALAANGNLCKTRSKLKMPTEFVAQNGAVFRKSINIAVTGCLNKKRPTRATHREASGTKRGTGR